MGFLRGFSASRIGLILEPVIGSLEEKGKKIQDCNYDPGFGKCCSNGAKSWRKSDYKAIFFSCVGAARKVSPNWSLETMTCHSSHCFSIVWGQGNAPLVTSLLSSCCMTHFFRIIH